AGNEEFPLPVDNLCVCGGNPTWYDARDRLAADRYGAVRNNPSVGDGDDVYVSDRQRSSLRTYRNTGNEGRGDGEQTNRGFAMNHGVPRRGKTRLYSCTSRIQRTRPAYNTVRLKPDTTYAIEAAERSVRPAAS